MKKIAAFLFFALLLIACKEQNKEVVNNNLQVNNEEEKPAYPEDIANVFNAHGGMDTWNKMNNLCYEMNGRGGKEIHTISLKDRKRSETRRMGKEYCGHGRHGEKG